jgi:hypothetical protein
MGSIINNIISTFSTVNALKYRHGAIFSTIIFEKNCLTKMPFNSHFSFFGLKIRAFPWRYFREWWYFRAFTVFKISF